MQAVHHLPKTVQARVEVGVTDPGFSSFSRFKAMLSPLSAAIIKVPAAL
jgi:hypothetical protein